MAELANIHAGDVLREEFIAPMGLAVHEVAIVTDIPEGDLTSLIDGRREVDADTARRLSRSFGTSVRFWVGLQSAYDSETAQRKV